MEWMIDEPSPSRLAWQINAEIKPRISRQAMPKGREPLAKLQHAKPQHADAA